MPRYIVKLADNEYVEFSTVVEAPVSQIVDRKIARALWGEERIERADTTGCSAHPPFCPKPGESIDQWLESETLNNGRWDTERIRKEIGYA